MKDDESSKDLYGQMDEIANDMERLFYHLFCPKDPARSVATRKWHPLTDIIETEDRIIIKLELAGVEKDNISITLDKDRLTISGCRKETLPPNIKGYHQMEINYGEFERVLPLKQGTGKASISATFGNGFLTITIDTTKTGGSKKSVPVDID
jgi:HSP20 family protein